MPDVITIVITLLISGVVFFPLGVLFRKKTAESKIEGAKSQAEKIVADAHREAETKKKESILEAKEKIQEERAELDKEIKDRRAEIQRQESRLLHKEETLDRKIATIENKEQSLLKEGLEIDKKLKEIEELKEQELRKLQEISTLSIEQAKMQILALVEEKMQKEKATIMRKYDAELKDEKEKLANQIIGYAIQKCAVDHTSEVTVTTVSIPNDDMKGRIIGREGRNIRTLEALTGIDLIIDDTPEAVVISGFDPLRREVAKIALEKLLSDGRIHPTRIEETVEKAKEEVEKIIKDEGERATLETGVNGLHPDIVKLIGKLKYRTSYGQNVLNHSIEVSQLAGIMASELGLNAKLAKRAGLLHDIGKALDHDMEGTHIQIGVDLLKKYGENDIILNAVGAHHGDIEPTSIISVLIQAADAISASRPGARRETVEAYIKRLQQLEEISNSFKGVEKSFAIQAGREVRIIIKPEDVSEDNMTILARQIAEQIETQMEYPGQIKVNLVRETRAIEFAK